MYNTILVPLDGSKRAAGVLRQRSSQCLSPSGPAAVTNPGWRMRIRGGVKC